MFAKTFTLLCFLFEHVHSENNTTFCSVDGNSYPPGTTFDIDCHSRCHCNTDGEYTCLSMCPPQVFGPDCRMVKRIGECCLSGDCHLEASCATFSQLSVAFPVTAPWQVGISVDEERTCFATIIGNRYCSVVKVYNKSHESLKECFLIFRELLTTSKCVLNKSNISFIGPNQDWKVNRIFAPVQNLSVTIIVLDQPIVFTKSVHEINIPWQQICKYNDSCGLLLSSSSSDSFVFAKNVERQNCDGLRQNNDSFDCLEISNAVEPCTNLDGVSVLMEKGGVYFIIGIVIDDISQNHNSCNGGGSRFRKFINICSKIADHLSNSE